MTFPKTMNSSEQNAFVVAPNLPLKIARTTLGVSLFFFVFYIAGHYVFGFPFPAPLDLLQIFFVAFSGVLLGVAFSRVWPLPPRVGFERIVRVFLLMAPALGLGLALHVLLQGPQAERALYLIFALAAWLGSGYIVRVED
jgi:hypothetical protein